MNNFEFRVGYYGWPISIRHATRKSLVLLFILALFQLTGNPTRAEGRAAPLASHSNNKDIVQLDSSTLFSANPTTPPSSEPAESGLDAPQLAFLYEDDPTHATSGGRYVGSVVWHTEAIKYDVSQQAGVAVRADVDIPDRKLKMRMLIFRNADPSFQASHTAEFSFMLPADFGNGGGIFDVPGILMKPDELHLGVPLSGGTVKVADGFFRFKLSNVDADRSRNLMLLKEAPWFSIPIVYNNLHRAVIVIEKGKSGYEAFATAFGP
jgi:hypothetical protein